MKLPGRRGREKEKDEEDVEGSDDAADAGSEERKRRPLRRDFEEVQLIVCCGGLSKRCLRREELGRTVRLLPCSGVSLCTRPLSNRRNVYAE